MESQGNSLTCRWNSYTRKILENVFLSAEIRRQGPRMSPALKTKQNTGGFWVKTTNGEKRLCEVYRPLVEILVGLFEERRLPHKIKIPQKKKKKKGYQIEHQCLI